MVTLSLIEKAIAIAFEAHKGKKDKGGTEYILHPLRIMHMVQGTNEKIVALLHDVLEDSNLTIQYLTDQGFPSAVLNAVDLLSKKEGATYELYILAIKKCPLAKKIKLADLADNLNARRLKKLGTADLVRLKKYREAIKTLNT